MGVVLGAFDPERFRHIGKKSILLGALKVGRQALNTFGGNEMLFPDEFWVQLGLDKTFTCPFCKGTVPYRHEHTTGQCVECMSLFHEYAGTPRFFTSVEPRFDMIKVWAEKGELVVWFENTEENRKVLSEVYTKRKGAGGKN